MTLESLPAARSLKHVNVLDPLRGLAALAVVLFHYSGSILPTIRPNYFTAFFDPGHYGVHVFFVISGFVIPYAMYRSGYTLNGYGRFMARRFIRIAPPAYVAAILVIIYHQASWWILGRPVDAADWPGVDLRSILGNVIFHPQFFDTMWFNFPYWTLMIEFQFYLLIGLILPLLLDRQRSWIPVLVILALLLLTLLERQYFFRYSPFFIFGVLIFLYKQDHMKMPVFAVTSILALGLCLLLDIPSLLVAAGTGALILFEFQFHDRFTTWLGRISYSLYIIHVPVGFISETALKRMIDLHEYPAGKVFLLFFYTMLALIAAHLFHRLVEKPFLNFSKRLIKRSTKTTPGDEEPAVPSL